MVSLRQSPTHLLLLESGEKIMAVETNNGAPHLWLTEGVHTTEDVARDFVRLQQQGGPVRCNAFTVVDLNRVMAEMGRWSRELPSITVGRLLSFTLLFLL